LKMGSHKPSDSVLNGPPFASADKEVAQ